MTLTTVLLWLEYLGTVAFAVSGALVGIKKHMDIFGVTILGLCPAVCGGLIRDIILNVSPPNMFRNPIFAIIGAVTSIILFLKPVRQFVLDTNARHDWILFWADTLGLAAFTVSALRTVYIVHPNASLFFRCFLAVMTGVGGGMLRDVLAQETPAIFVKKIYALASLAGAVAACLIWKYDPIWAVVVGFLLVVAIRYLAMRFRWNLPRA